jgi:hypothetical protein
VEANEKLSIILSIAAIIDGIAIVILAVQGAPWGYNVALIVLGITKLIAAKLLLSKHRKKGG